MLQEGILSWFIHFLLNFSSIFSSFINSHDCLCKIRWLTVEDDECLRELCLVYVFLRRRILLSEMRLMCNKIHFIFLFSKDQTFNCSSLSVGPQ